MLRYLTPHYNAKSPFAARTSGLMSADPGFAKGSAAIDHIVVLML
jgi:hypothetical protein